MKNHLFIFIAILFSSCTSSKGVVEKTLLDVGNGKYRYIELLGDFGKWEHCSLFFGFVDDNYPFTDIEVTKLLIDKSDIGYTDKKYMTLALFNTNVLFDRITLVSTKESTINVLNRDKYKTTKDDEESMNMSAVVIKEMNQYYSELQESRKNDEYYKEYSDYYVYCEYRDVPQVVYSYKLDNNYIAEVKAVKLPKKGWKISSIRISQ